jgi:hypothetical protein
MPEHTPPDRPYISEQALIVYENGIAVNAAIQPPGESTQWSITIDEIHGEVVFFLFQDAQQCQRFFATISVEITVRRISHARVYLVGFREPTDWSTVRTPIQLNVDLAYLSQIYDYGFLYSY